jgi:hypothetical protein
MSLIQIAHRCRQRDPFASQRFEQVFQYILFPRISLFDTAEGESGSNRIIIIEFPIEVINQTGHLGLKSCSNFDAVYRDWS